MVAPSTGRSRIAVIVCAHNERACIEACLQSLTVQDRRPDEILVVDNASTDGTGGAASAVPGVRVVPEPRKGLVRARQTGYGAARGDLLLYIDADCRAPRWWVARIERRFACRPGLVALSGTYRFHDWHLAGRALIRAYDCTLAPVTHVLLKYVFRCGVVFYGGNFAVRRAALDAIGGFDTSIEFHGEDTNLGRRLARVGAVTLSDRCWVHTSARRYRAMGTWAVIGLYVRNFWSEILRHRPADGTHRDVRDHDPEDFAGPSQARDAPVTRLRHPQSVGSAADAVSSGHRFPAERAGGRYTGRNP